MAPELGRAALHEIVHDPEERENTAENKGGLRRALNVVKRFARSLPAKKGKIYRAADRLSGLMRKAIDATAAERTEGVAYALPIGKEIVDPRTVTEEDVRTLLENVQNGAYKSGTCIPLRIGTPQFLINVVAAHSKGSYKVEDFPMGAEADHLLQIMDEDDRGDYGDHRPHGLDVEDIVKVLSKMGDPSYIALQNNGRYAEVVSIYNKRNKQILVSIDFADRVSENKKNYKHRGYMNGYAPGYYNIIVTQYEPDDLRSYLGNNEVVYDKKDERKVSSRIRSYSGRHA